MGIFSRKPKAPKVTGPDPITVHDAPPTLPSIEDEPLAIKPGDELGKETDRKYLSGKDLVTELRKRSALREGKSK